MQAYLIGAGAVLTTREQPALVPATLHAQVSPLLATGVRAGIIDLEASRPEELSRVVAFLTGADRAGFDTRVVRCLVERGTCSAAGVMATLAEATGSSDVHVFARWLPNAEMLAELRAAGIRAIMNPLESLQQVALVSGQRIQHWPARFRAA